MKVQNKELRLSFEEMNIGEKGYLEIGTKDSPILDQLIEFIWQKKSDCSLPSKPSGKITAYSVKYEQLNVSSFFQVGDKEVFLFNYNNSLQSNQTVWLIDQTSTEPPQELIIVQVDAVKKRIEFQSTIQSNSSKIGIVIPRSRPFIIESSRNTKGISFKNACLSVKEVHFEGVSFEDSTGLRVSDGQIEGNLFIGQSQKQRKIVKVEGKFVKNVIINMNDYLFQQTETNSVFEFNIIIGCQACLFEPNKNYFTGNTFVNSEINIKLNNQTAKENTFKIDKLTFDLCSVNISTPPEATLMLSDSFIANPKSIQISNTLSQLHISQGIFINVSLDLSQLFELKILKLLDSHLISENTSLYNLITLPGTTNQTIEMVSSYKDKLLIFRESLIKSSHTAVEISSCKFLGQFSSLLFAEKPKNSLSQETRQFYVSLNTNSINLSSSSTIPVQPSQKPKDTTNNINQTMPLINLQKLILVQEDPPFQGIILEIQEYNLNSSLLKKLPFDYLSSKIAFVSPDLPSYYMISGVEFAEISSGGYYQYVSSNDPSATPTQVYIDKPLQIFRQYQHYLTFKSVHNNNPLMHIRSFNLRLFFTQLNATSFPQQIHSSKSSQFSSIILELPHKALISAKSKQFDDSLELIGFTKDYEIIKEQLVFAPGETVIFVKHPLKNYLQIAWKQGDAVSISFHIELKLCKDNFYLKDGKCVESCLNDKIQGVFCVQSCESSSSVISRINPQICEKCPFGCGICNSSKQCSQCEQGMKLISGKCVNNCDKGFYEKGKQCIACAQNCENCSQTECISCKKYDFGEICTDKSPQNSKINQTCPQFCRECFGNSKFECVQCALSYQKDKGICLPASLKQL